MNRLTQASDAASEKPRRKYGLRDVVSYAYNRVFYDFLPRLIGNLIFRLKCLLFGVSTGKNINCFGPVHVIRAPGSRIVIGDNTVFVSRSSRSTAASIYSACKLRTHFNTAVIEIGHNVALNGASITARSKKIKIGAGTMLAPNVIVIDSDFHQAWPPESRRKCLGTEFDKDVSIGRNVWVGINSIILKGVTIGDNSIIGAGSVVVDNIPADSLAAGNPAKVCKKYGPEGQ